MAENRVTFALLAQRDLLESHNAGVRRAFHRVLAQRGIAVEGRRTVNAVHPVGVSLADGAVIAADVVLVATGAAAPGWLADTGLSCDAGGFLVIATLQVLNDPHVFAAGDCATMIDAPRPKAGAFAVRAGPPLTGSLRRALSGEKLRFGDPNPCISR